MKYIDYVNIKMGTKNERRCSSGNALPLVQQPFGFASFSPQTDSLQHLWFYQPDSHSFEGIRLTHQPSPWIGDHGAIVIQPQTFEPFLNPDLRWSSFKKDETVLKPNYIKYRLNRSKCNYELTPTCYGAWIRLNFESKTQDYLSLLPVKNEYSFKVLEDNRTVVGYTDNNDLLAHDELEGKNFKMYYVFRFEDDAVDAEKTLVDNNGDKKRALEIHGENTGIHIALKKKNVTVKMATSYISIEQAVLNLEREDIYKSFEELKDSNESVWEEYLSRVTIKTNDENKMKTFCSCMYRAFLFPHKAYEIDADNNPVHYAPHDDGVYSGYRYTDNGFWDTYRTVYPFYALAAREEYKEILEAFITQYKVSGWFPRWTAMSAKNCMPSTLIDAVLADAAAKDMLEGELLKTAFEGMEHHAKIISQNPALGREGCEEYNKIGYVPYGKYRETVNLTLDAAYGDWCIAQIAKKLGYQDKYDEYIKRSKNYKNLFDKKTGFMRAKDSGGNFRPDFEPLSWGTDYTEASAWQTTFAVQHDFEGLAELYGGKDKLIEKLDEFFAMPQDYSVKGYGFEIHEMNEMTAGNWGQCAISNQPSFHIPYIYADLGECEKTNYWIERISNEAFTCEDDGFPGDDDNGTMSLWYIFSIIGFYPLCPGKDEYIKTKLLADEVYINGKKINHSEFNSRISYKDILK